MSVYLTDLLLKLGARVPLNMGERAVLLAVCFRVDDAGECGFSQSDIAAQLGMGKSAASRIFSRLRALGLIAHRIPHGISVCTDTLTAYQPAPIGSGKLFAGEAELREKGLLREQPQLPPEQPELLAKQLKLPAEQPQESYRQAVAPQATQGQESSCSASNHGCSGSNSRVAPQATKSCSASNPIYKTDIKDTQDRARVREEALTASPGAAAPKPPQDGEHSDGLAAFVGAYPEGKAPRDTDKLASAWYDATVTRKRTPKTLMAALERAKASKGWLEQDGRFIPRPEVWLAERGYEAYLTADERTTPEQRQAKAIGWVEASLASFARMGYTPAEIARIRAKATPAVLAGRNPDDAVADAILALKAEGAIAD